MILSHAILTIAVAFAVAWFATRAVIPLLRKNGVLDIPNVRSSHGLPTPRGGGIGILAGLAAGFVAASFLGLKLPGVELLVGAALIAIIGFVDDRFGGSSVLFRLTAQLAAAALIVWRGGALERFPLPQPLDFELATLAVPVSLLWIVGVLNLYNFLDGIDGFAGLQAVVAGLGIALWGHGDIAVVGFAIAGACAGFLLHNWHPAKIFMGDVGSGTLGFMLAALPFQLTPASRGDAMFVVAMCLWFFLSDGCFTIMRRLSRGEKIWEAHRSHLYQRLVKTGLRHDRVTLHVIGAAAVLSALAVVAARSGGVSSRWSVFAAAGASFFAYYCWTWARERQHLGKRFSAEAR